MTLVGPGVVVYRVAAVLRAIHNVPCTAQTEPQTWSCGVCGSCECLEQFAARLYTTTTRTKQGHRGAILAKHDTKNLGSGGGV